MSFPPHNPVIPLFLGQSEVSGEEKHFTPETSAWEQVNLTLGLSEDEELGEHRAVRGDRKSSCRLWAESRSQSRASWAQGGGEAGLGNFHGQRPGYIVFLSKVVVGTGLLGG